MNTLTSHSRTHTHTHTPSLLPDCHTVVRFAVNPGATVIPRALERMTASYCILTHVLHFLLCDNFIITV
jgi:hypothetical protein